jgi:hypothetical protein
MARFQKISLFLVAAMLLAQPLFAGASPRLVPQGSVKLLASGTVVDKEMPAPAGTLMACNGQCYIEANGLQLMGSDKTVFAVHEEGDKFIVMVQEGNIEFALSANSKPVEFKTPFDSLDARPHMVPTSSDAVVRGTLQVTKERAVLSLSQGSLELTNSDGQKLIHAGNSLVLAQAVVGGGAAGGAAAGGTTLAGAAVAVGGAAAIGGAIATTDTDDDDDDEVSPF